MGIDITKFGFFKLLAAKGYVEDIWLYGSRARGDNRERSDIDLAINCPTATDSDWFDIIDIIENADTLLNIDCTRLDQLDEQSDLKHNIQNQGIKLFTRG